jgi:hypothetical protein
MGPRDTPEGMPYPVNPIDGRPISDAQKRRIGKLREASFLVRAVLHEIDGTSFVAEIGPTFDVEDHYGTRDLALAATKLDECMLWAAKAALTIR